MKLSAEQFAELEATFKPQGSPRRLDRRRANRTDLRARIRITPIAAGEQLESFEVMVCDFSARGIAFLHSTPMVDSDQFITQLPRRSGGSVQLLCTVMHCVEISADEFRIGADFTSTTPVTGQEDGTSTIGTRRTKESMLR